MYKYFFNLILLSLIFISPSLSENFNKVIINGNSRIADETIKVFSKIPSNKILNENSLNLMLKDLYNTGFFKDVDIKIKDGSLIIAVIENPIIETLFIKGIKAKKMKVFIEENLILKDRASFNIYNVKKDEISIISKLKDKGYYFAKIESSIEELGDNKINLIYSVKLGDKARISKISFIGNKIFKNSKLKNIIVSEEYKFWKVVTGKKFLNEELINFDNKLLGNFYKNNGYYNVEINTSYANYLGNNNFELIYNINANEKYYFNNIELNLPDDYDIANFKELLDTFEKLKGEHYSLSSINSILDKIDKISLSDQYEFLSSTVTEKINDNLIDFAFNIQELERLYVEKINIFGNTITREEVIRNQLIVD